jgi:hypothetical protein
MEVIWISFTLWAFLGFAWWVRRSHDPDTRHSFYAYVASLVVVLAVAYGVTYTTQFAVTTDTETWNGAVSKKVNDVRQCPAGWQTSEDSFCEVYDTRSVYDGQDCTTDSKGDRSCVDKYHTEYRYVFPWEGKWFIESADLGEVWEVDRVDRQGALKPPLYASTHEGDPVSSVHRYTNWVRAASDSLFNEGYYRDRYDAHLPAYPQETYDLFKMDRVVQVGLDLPEDQLREYDRLLSVALAELGPKRQMNAIVVLLDARVADVDYPPALRRAWKGFKKNDAVLFVAVNDGLVDWVDVMSWSKDDSFNVLLRDDLANMRGKELDFKWVALRLYSRGMEHYVRRPMAEFEYLRDDLPTPWYAILLTYALQAGAVFGVPQLIKKVKK